MVAAVDRGDKMGSHQGLRKFEGAYPQPEFCTFSFSPAIAEVTSAGARVLDARVALIGNCKLDYTPWIEAVLPNCSLRPVSESYTADVSPARADYDLLVAAGSDVKRIKQFLKIYRPLLNAKPKIVLTSDSMPKDRASLLNAGFDDVLDTRMPHLEGQARISAIYARYHEVAARAEAQAQKTAAYEQYLAPGMGDEVNPREASILSALIGRSPRAVPSFVLRDTLADRPAVSLATLRVILSSLRSKIIAPFIIVSVAPSSYALIDESSDWNFV